MTTSEALPRNPFTVSWWSAFFFSGYSANSLGLFRIWFAATMILYALWDFGYLLEMNPLGPAFHYADPIWYFRLVGILVHVPWLTPLVLLLLLAATVALGMGFRTRVALLVMFFSIAYLQGIRDSFDGAIHHRMVVPANILIVLFFSRCADVLSRDASRRRRLGQATQPIENWSASWPLRAIQVYMAFYYFFAAVAKLRLAGWEWIGDGGKVQLKLIDRSMRYGMSEAGEPVRMKLGYLLAQTPTWLVIFVTAVIVFELLSPLILLAVRSLLARLVFVACATAFHIANFVLLSVNFIFYPLLLAVFFDLEKVHRRLQARFGWRPLPPAPGAPPGVASASLATAGKDSSQVGAASDPDVVEILYDRQCPVCDTYCNLADVRQDAGRVTLLDARQDSALLREVTARSLDIDEGMVVRYHGEIHYGADAIHVLALLSPRKSLFDRLTYLVFRSQRRARILYPILKAGRNLLLKLLGRTRIDNLGSGRASF